MKKPGYFIFLLTYWLSAFSKSVTASTTMPTTTNLFDLDENEFKGDSLGLKYKTSRNNTSEKAQMTISLAKVLNFYNAEVLARDWNHINGLLSQGCRKNVNIFLESLKQAEKWALKMEDASGRYSTGWYWGNHYWTGSQNLCENIAPADKTIVVDSLNRSSKSEFRIKSSPSQTNGYKAGPMDYSSIPPFALSFYMLKIHINSTILSEDKILYLGLCMPSICSDKDVQTILEESTKNSRVDVKVEGVKSHHSYFYISQDLTFILLCAATSFVIVCLMAGTSYDYYLKYTQKRRNVTQIPQNKANNNNLFVVNDNMGGSLASSRSTFEETLADRPKFSWKSVMRLILKETVLSFSLRSNIKTICDQSVSSDTIPVIHGLKSMSMAWVILGHTCIIAFKYSDNMEYRKVVQRQFFFQTIANGAFSVDTFFFTSGLLVSFLYFRTNAKGKLDPITKGHSRFVAGLAHFFGLIIYRFARLTAPYLFTLGVVNVSMKWFNYNSIFEPPTMDHVNCPKYWWRNVLYINTLFPVEEMCMLWSWYLSDDTQFYIIGAIMLILAASHFKSGAIMLLIFMISSWITTGYISYMNSHIPNTDDPLALFDKIYDKPWTRFGPYLIGMCVGWFLFKKNCQLKMTRLVVISGWILSLSCLFALVFGLYEVNLSPFVGAMYSALSHSAWALGLSWIVIACSTGHGGFANTILSAPILYPFSRITYCAYLLHPVVMRTMTMTMDSPIHLGTISMIIMFLGQVFASYALSFFVSLAFEAPVVGMLRIMAKVAPPPKK